MSRVDNKAAWVVLIGLISTIVFSLGIFVGVEAYSGTVFGRKEGYGYFKDKKVSGSSGSDGYVLKKGITGVNSPKDFIKFLKDRNNGSGQDEAGSAFIVYTMLGKNGKDRDKDISGSDWDELEARVRSLDARGNISWSKNVSLSINSYHQEYKNSKGKTVHDDAFYSKNSNEKSIVFKDDKGKVIYALAHKCANPMGNKGDFEGLPEANKWDISTKSELVSAPVSPGQTITWRHTAKNDGPDKTDKNVGYRYENTGDLGSGHGSDSTLPSGTDKNSSRNFTSSHTITQDNVGRNLCRATSASPEAWDDDGRTTSSSACLYIPYNYRLTPGITTNVSGTVEANTSFSVIPNVTNAGPTKSKDTQWRITEIVVVPGRPVPNAAGGTSPEVQPPCGNFFSGPGANCSTIANGTGSQVFNVGGSTLASRSVTSGDYEVGTQICYAFSVQPRASSIPSNPGNDNQWAHSAPVCLTIGKKPKTQIWGGDLSVRNGLAQASTAVKRISGVNRTFGSWVEYSAAASGLISGVGTGSAFAEQGMLNASVCSYSRLTFTNAGAIVCSDTTAKGNYNLSSTMPDIATSFPVNLTDSSRNLGNNVTINLSQNNLQGIYRATGTVNINGGGAGQFIKKGQWIVINAPLADVTINGDINYTTEVLSAIEDIPQVVIIARNINIVDSVRNVDAWLVSSGIINTCSSVAVGAPLTSNMCNNLLRVNGPVMSQKLYLRRTAGSGTGANSGDPAEIFNLRPDAYLWSVARANSYGQIQTVDTIELPPRF